ncbi:MAG: 4Fe-4S binding protein [Thermodesulfobacteriota bacterium]|nr:4Fe-4S binding protein [Thermodesulfobacteriota bacterium]
MPEDIYRQVQKQLDTYSMGFPATTSGVEIKILKYLFSEADAEMFVNMTHNLETPATVAERIGQPEDTVAARLDDMAERGLLFRLKKGGASRYAAIPFVHGLFEFQVKNLDRGFSEMVQVYFDEAFDAAMQEGAEYFLRPIPVQRSIDVAHHVASYDDAVAILKSKPKIVVTDCICRKRTGVLEKGCGKQLEACFMFGSMGQYYLDRAMGREVSLDEAVAILETCREQGLVTQPATAQNPAGMCNCCGDCCGVLVALNKHPKPSEIVISSYYARVDADECTGCEACVDRCQMNAIHLDDDGVAGINLDRCIGCGLCVTTCPVEAIELAPKPDQERVEPPPTMMEQMVKMAQKRGIL